MNPAATLLVLGIHREERDFGREVAAGLQAREVAVLEIPEGLSGRRPRPDQCFRYDTLHRALYLQLLPHILKRHRLLIDLHTGFDENGPCADFICADAPLRERLLAALEQDGADAGRVRVIPLGPPFSLHARTVIPEQIWNNRAFRYLGLEIYLADEARSRAPAVALARRLVGLAAGCVEHEDAPGG
ncbi:hypothetical protein [Thauera sinica]|uniref:Uncharacterized protein n=1 Tax=Thauera sinica TaxID=2665146 RepID=A0ABW1AWS6_9RHOO|nr:hypothetical protein [Thauera sp. K11]ATE61082.1 hypothetical protein CCZ27_15070 [Thauera sp. K11]